LTSDGAARVRSAPQAAVQCVTTLEEMRVQEALDGLADLHERTGGAIRPGGIFINMARPAMLGEADLAAAASGSLDVGELALGLKAAGISDNHALAPHLMTQPNDPPHPLPPQNNAP